jgi:hypothetical protein
VLHLKDPKNSTKKLLDLKNIFGNVAGCKIYVQKPLAFLYANNRLRKKKRKQSHSQQPQKLDA